MFNQENILCIKCGGSVHADKDFFLTCPYCGTEDRLPEDELERAFELKTRVSLAKKSILQLKRTQKALAHIFESKKAVLFYENSFF